MRLPDWRCGAQSSRKGAAFGVTTGAAFFAPAPPGPSSHAYDAMTDSALPETRQEPHPEWPPLRERRISWTDTAFLFEKRRSMSGRDFFTALAAGDLPPAPLYEAYGFSLQSVGDGAATLAVVPHDWIYNPLGTVHGGLLATIIDSATGIAVQSQLPLGQLSNTVQLHVDFIRGITAASGPLECRARVAKPGRQIAIADAELVGADGTVYGRGSGTFMIFPALPESEGAKPVQPAEPQERVIRSPDPTFLAAQARRMKPLEFLNAIAEGRLPPPTIAASLDFDMGPASLGHVEFRCTPKPYHYNPLGSVHGGLAATLIDSSTGCAVQTTLDDGEGLSTVSLAVDFFRPIRLDAGPLSVPGWIAKGGRRLSVADAEVRDADGRVYARGSATCLRYRFKDVDR